MERDKDTGYMKRCLRLARRGLGRTSPNPVVGAVVVKDGEVIAEGYHHRAGEPHAEVNALTEAGERARGAALYVNLEPCVHYGRTFPCVDRIIEAGVRRVVIGMVDPNPLVNGKGIKCLRQAGIEVTSGILEEECYCLNEAYVKHITTGLPFVILKMALSLDGRITSQDAGWITGIMSRRAVHRLRGQVDAILVGLGTVKKDDPQLTTRFNLGRDPTRIILDTKARISLKAKVITEDPAKTIIAAAKPASPGKIERLRARGIDVLLVSEKKGLVDLKDLLKELGRLAITSILVEGGARVATSFLKEGLIDKVIFFISPRIIGGGGLTAIRDRLPFSVNLKRTTYKRVGEDTLITGYIDR